MNNIDKTIKENKLILPNSTLLEIKNLIKIIDPKLFLYPSTLKKELNQSKQFMQENFSLIKVKHATLEKVNKSLARFSQKKYDIKKYIEYFNSIPRLINPYEIPIKQVLDGYFDGKILTIECNDSKINNQIDYIINNIIITNKTSNYLGTIITHEITHSQLETGKLKIQKNYNSEMLPIFLGLIYSSAIEKKEINTEYIYRLKELEILINYLSKKENLETSKAYQASIYLESSLKALELYNYYSTSNKLKQKELIDLINKIFNNYLILEEFLEKYELTLESAESNLHKSLVKRV